MVRYPPEFDGHFSNNSNPQGPSRRSPPGGPKYNDSRPPPARLADRMGPSLEDRINGPLRTDLPRSHKHSYDSHGPSSFHNSGSAPHGPKALGNSSYKNSSLDNRISSSSNQNYNLFDNGSSTGPKSSRPYQDTYIPSKRARPNDSGLQSRIEGDELSQRISNRSPEDYRPNTTSRGRPTNPSSRPHPRASNGPRNRSASPRHNSRRDRDDEPLSSESNLKTKQAKTKHPAPEPPTLPLAMRLENGDNDNRSPSHEPEPATVQEPQAPPPVSMQDLFPEKALAKVQPNKPAPKSNLVYVDIGESPYPDLLIETLSEPVLHELQRQGYTRLRINYGEHRHVFRLLIRKARTIASGIHIYSDPDSSVKSQAYLHADLVILHSGPRLLQSLRDKKALIVVGYDGWMTAEQRGVLSQLYKASALAVTESGHLLDTLKTLDIDTLNPTYDKLRKAIFDCFADAKEPKLKKKELNDLQFEVMSSTTAGSKLDDISEAYPRDIPKSERRQTPVPEILQWLETVRLSDKDIFQPPTKTHLRRAIEDNTKFQSVVRLVSEARRQPGFPTTIPPVLSMFHEAIIRDYNDEQELNMKRKIRIDDFRNRRTGEMEQFKKDGMFPMKQYVWKEIETDKTQNLKMFSRTRSKKTGGKINIKMERLSPSPESEVSPVATEPSPPATSDDTPMSEDMPVDQPDKNSEETDKMDVEPVQTSPPLTNPNPSYQLTTLSVPVLHMTPKPTNEHLTYPRPFSVPPNTPAIPTNEDIAVLYCILSTFPFTEIWVIPPVYSALLSKPWPFPGETNRDIADFIKKHLPFHKVAGDSLVTYDPKQINRLRSQAAQLPPLSECTIEGLSDRISALTSALSPSDRLVRKVWHLAYRGLLFPREIGGQKFENYEQFQRARGILPLSEEERVQHAGDFVEYATDRVRENWDVIDAEVVKALIERRQADE